MEIGNQIRLLRQRRGITQEDLEIQGMIDRAIEMYQRMITITKEDWTTEGEGVDYIIREIARLEKMR